MVPHSLKALRRTIGKFHEQHQSLVLIPMGIVNPLLFLVSVAMAVVSKAKLAWISLSTNPLSEPYGPDSLLSFFEGISPMGEGYE